MEPAQFEAWLGGGTSGPLSANGEKIFANSAASPAIAPTRKAAARIC